MVDQVGTRKSELRRRMRLVRDVIDDRLLRSVALWAAVAATPEYQRSSTVMAFAGIDGEPDTDPLFGRLDRDGKRLALPSMVDGLIEPRLIGPGLAPGVHGVPSPQGDVVRIEELDLVIVPGLAFTIDGARLGRGGGHYDRFLAGLAPGCRTVGVCFVEQLLDEIPLEPHDRRVDLVVTDTPDTQ